MTKELLTEGNGRNSQEMLVKLNQPDATEPSDASTLLAQCWDGQQYLRNAAGLRDRDIVELIGQVQLVHLMLNDAQI